MPMLTLELIIDYSMIVMETGLFFGYMQNALAVRFSKPVTVFGMSLAQLLYRALNGGAGLVALVPSFLLDFTLVCIFFRGRKTKKLFLACMFYCFLFIFDAVATISVPFVYNRIAAEPKTGEDLYYVCVAASKLLCLVMILILNGTFRTEARLRVWWSVLPVPLITVVLLIAVFPFTYEGSGNETALVAAVSVFSLLLNLFLLAYVRREWERARLRERLLLTREMKRLQEAHFGELQTTYRQIEKTAHENKKHMEYLAYAPDVDSVRRYIQAVQARGFAPLRRYTGNFDIDVILNVRQRDMERAGVGLEVRGALPSSIPWLDPVDISVILGNGLTNAMEASQAIQGEISALFRYDDAAGWLVITIMNPVSKDAAPTREGRRLRSTKAEAGHGFGLENMEDSARRYDGHINTRLAE